MVTEQLIKYGIVGAVSNFAGYLVYLIVTYWDVEPITAMTLLYIVGASFGFLGNRKWAFAHNGELHGAVLRYLIAHVGGYLINLCILLILVDRFGYPHQLVQAGAIGIVAGFLFLVFKHFVFPKVEDVAGERNENVY